MTEACASRSLRLLSDAGLLTTRRHGRDLLYQLMQERLDLTDALANFVSQRGY
jgi:hypothetical protein